MGTNHGSEVYALIFYRVPLNRYMVLSKYRVAINLCNMSQIVTKLANIISYNSRVLAPECKAKYLHIVSIGPNEPDLWPHVLDSEGHNSKKKTPWSPYFTYV
jgi:hypothetical protein